jgi:hypothetical protein
MSRSSAEFVLFAGRKRPADPVERADFETTMADLRAAVCLEAGVAPEFIDSRGYDISDKSYARARASWVRHIRQWGINLFRTDVEEAFALWQDSRPDLAEGDDWREAGAQAHKAVYPGGGCFYGDCCVICCPYAEG